MDKENRLKRGDRYIVAESGVLISDIPNRCVVGTMGERHRPSLWVYDTFGDRREVWWEDGEFVAEANLGIVRKNEVESESRRQTKI